MAYKQILLTRRLFLLKMKKLQKYHRELNIRAKPEIQKSYLETINKSIENNTVYCKICGEKIDESYIGKMIVINKNCTSYARKWRHVECCKIKNLTIEEEGDKGNVQN